MTTGDELNFVTTMTSTKAKTRQRNHDVTQCDHNVTTTRSATRMSTTKHDKDVDDDGDGDDDAQINHRSYRTPSVPPHDINRYL
jgi:hypothetical protein